MTWSADTIQPQYFKSARSIHPPDIYVFLLESQVLLKEITALFSQRKVQPGQIATFTELRRRRLTLKTSNHHMGHVIRPWEEDKLPGENLCMQHGKSVQTRIHLMMQSHNFNLKSGLCYFPIHLLYPKFLLGNQWLAGSGKPSLKPSGSSGLCCNRRNKGALQSHRFAHAVASIALLKINLLCFTK